MNDIYLTFLSDNNLKNTAQRAQIFQIIHNEPSHFSIEDILQKAKGEIRPATLYRVLRLLVDSQILMEHHFGGKTLFERIDCKHHDHIICEKCEKITEFHSYEIEKIQENIMKEKGFILTSHKHELYGLCKKCQ